jgi:hypothetical protein
MLVAPVRCISRSLRKNTMSKLQTSFSIAPALVGLVLLANCTTNTFVSGVQDGGPLAEAATVESVCTKLSKLPCGQSISACTQNYDACKGSDADKQSMLNCFTTATFACKASVPTTDQCASETARACTAVASDGGSARPDASTSTSVCGGLCTLGSATKYTCREGSGVYVVSFGIGADTLGQRTCKISTDTRTVFTCDGLILDVNYNPPQVDGSWSVTGTTLTYESRGSNTVCTKQ